MKNLKQKAEYKVKLIEKIILENIDVFDSMPISLMSGKAGVLLFFIQRYLLSKKKKHYKLIGELLEKLIESLNEEEYGLSYCDGLTGIAFLLDYMNDQNLYSDDLKDLQKDIDAILLANLNKKIKEEDIDFLHGKLGVYYYLIKRRISDVSFKVEIDHFVDFIDNYMVDIFEKKSGKVFNLGLAHGFCAIVIILIKYSESYEIKKYDQILSRILHNIIKLKSTDKSSFSMFPSQASDFNNTSMYRIPLGWCYGDQVISMTILYYYKYTHDKYFEDVANEIADHWKIRNRTELIYPNNHYDEILCHGLSITAYLNKKWSNHSDDIVFLENYDIILEKILSKDDSYGVAGFKKLIDKNTATDSFAFLDGASGIGIFLLDYLGAPSSWDSILLLDI